MKYKIEHLYAIEWIDHCSDSGKWINNNEEFLQTPMAFKTVGYVVEDKKDYVVLSQSGHRDIEYRVTCAHMTIIKSCIKKSKRLEIGEFFGKIEFK